jgi:Tol biopolymer transport system component
MHAPSEKFARKSASSIPKPNTITSPYVLDFGTLSQGKEQRQTVRIESEEKANAAECKVTYSEQNSWFTVVTTKSVYKTTLFPLNVVVAVDTNHLPPGRRYDGWIAFNADDVTARVMLSVNVVEAPGQLFLTQLGRHLFPKLRVVTSVLIAFILVYSFILASAWWPTIQLSSLWSWLPPNKAFAGAKPLISPQVQREFMQAGQLIFSVYEDNQLTLYAGEVNGAYQHSLHIRGWSPVWSPDGEYIAFISKRNGTPQLYLMNPGNDEPLQLTNSPDEKSALAWSPDQKKLAFISGKPDLGILKIVNIPDRAIQAWANKQPTLVNEQADALNVLVETTAANQAQSAPHLGTINRFSWEPNGQSLLFDLKNAGKTNIFKANDQGVQLFTKDESRDPAWSPDGTLVAITAQQGIYTIDRHGQNMRRVNALHAWSPIWSPDGNLIAFLSDQDNPKGVLDLWITDIKGRYQARLTTSGCLTFAWSPDSQQLAYITGAKSTDAAFYLWLITPGQVSKLFAEVGEPYIAWRK